MSIFFWRASATVINNNTDVIFDIACLCDEEPHSFLAAYYLIRRDDVAVTSELRDSAVWKHSEDFGLMDNFFQKHTKTPLSQIILVRQVTEKLREGR